MKSKDIKLTKANENSKQQTDLVRPACSCPGSRAASSAIHRESPSLVLEGHSRSRSSLCRLEWRESLHNRVWQISNFDCTPCSGAESLIKVTPTSSWDCLESPPAMPVERVASVRCSLRLLPDAEPVLGKTPLQTRALQLTQKSAAAAPIARGRGDRKGHLCFDLCFYSKCL